MRKYLEPIWSALPEASKASLVAELAPLVLNTPWLRLTIQARNEITEQKVEPRFAKIYDTGHFAKQAPPVPVLAWAAQPTSRGRRSTQRDPHHLGIAAEAERFFPTQAAIHHHCGSLPFKHPHIEAPAVRTRDEDRTDQG